MTRSSLMERLGQGRGRSLAMSLKRCGLLLALAALPCLAVSGAASAATPPANKAPGSEAGGCAQQVWSDATNKPWFYNEAGETVVPQLNYEWLVVHVHADPAAAEIASTGELPPAVLGISKLLKEQLVEVIYDPGLDPDMCMYRLRSAENGSLLAGQVARHKAVRAVRPAYTIGEANFALLNAIDIRWKTQTSDQERLALLAKAGASASGGDLERTQRVRIDPCRSSVWATANLLHEDLHVVSASPVLAKIEPPVRATFTVGINGAAVGAPLPFSLEILFARHIRIEPATIANLNLCPPELSRQLCKVEYDQPLSAVDVTASPIRLEGRLYLYGTGEFALPEVPVYYRQSVAEEADLVATRTAQVPVRIASVIPNAPGRYQLKVAEIGTLPAITVADLRNRKTLGIFIAATGGVLFLACLIGFRRLAAPAAASAPVASVTDLMAQHAGVLRGLLAMRRETLDSAEIAAFGHAFRGYVGTQCAVAAGSMGGGAAMFFTTLRERLPAELHPPVQELLETIDTGLSRGQLRTGDVERLFTLARDVLDYYERHAAR